MPVVLQQDTIDQAKAVHAQEPWLWLWRIECDVTTIATTVLNVVRYPTTVTHDSKTYYPFPIDWSEFTEDGDGNLPTLDLRVSNVSKLLAERLHQGMGLIGNLVTLRIVPRHLAALTPGDPSDPDYFLERSFQIIDAAIDAQDITLRCELPNFYERLYPEARYNPNRCRFKYGKPGEGCPYVLNAGAAFLTCDKTLNACRARGFDMDLRGYPKGLLPMMFGGFPGTDIRS